MSIAVSGNHLVDGTGATVRLRGANYSGFEFTPFATFWYDDPSGGQAGQPNGPNYARMVSDWKFNCVRFPVHQPAWLGQITWDAYGNVYDSDPRRNYVAALTGQIDAAIAAGLYVIVSLHWSQPGYIACGRQCTIADSDNSLAFWTKMANVAKTRPNMILDLFNEPDLTFGILSGGTNDQVLMQGGVMKLSDSASNPPPSFGGFRRYHCMSLSSTLGWFRPGSVVSKGTVSSTVLAHDLARQKLFYATGSNGGTGTGGSGADNGPFTAGAGLTVTTRKTRPIISRACTAYASVNTASAQNAINNNNNAHWRSSGAMPVWWAVDISSQIGAIPSNPVGDQRKVILFVIKSELTYSYDVARFGTGHYNLPGDFTIDANTAAGGSTVPTTGWVTLKTVVGNAKTQLAYVLNAANASNTPYNWLRINVTAINGSAGNTDAYFKVYIFDASDSITGATATGPGTMVADGILMLGDSIQANAMQDGSPSGQTTTSMSDMVTPTTGHVMPQTHAGWPGATTSNFLADDGTGRGISIMQDYMNLNPMPWVAISLGANDAAGSATPNTALYVSRMLQLAQIAIANGRIPIIPTITFSNNTTRNTGHQACNAAMTAALASHPEIVVGPDVYAYFAANPTLINPVTDPDGGLHPTAAGNAGLRTLWGNWLQTVMYTPSATIVDPDAGWATPGHAGMINAVRATGATNVVMLGSKNFANDLSGWLANVPTDPLNQIVCSWHPYPPTKRVVTPTILSGGTGYVVGDIVQMLKPNTVYSPMFGTVTSVGPGGVVTGFAMQDGGIYLQTALPAVLTHSGINGTGTGSGLTFTATWGGVGGNFSDPSFFPVAQAIMAAYPLISGEIGEHSYAGLVGAPWITQFTNFADANAMSGLIGWSWNSATSGSGMHTHFWNAPAVASPINAHYAGGTQNILIKDSIGTPSDGYGVTFQTWAAGLSAFQQALTILLNRRRTRDQPRRGM